MLRIQTQIKILSLSTVPDLELHSLKINNFLIMRKGRESHCSFAVWTETREEVFWLICGCFFGCSLLFDLSINGGPSLGHFEDAFHQSELSCMSATVYIQMLHGQPCMAMNLSVTLLLVCVCVEDGHNMGMSPR